MKRNPVIAAAVMLAAVAPSAAAPRPDTPAPAPENAPENARCPEVPRARTNVQVRTLMRDRPETRAVLVLAGGCEAVKAYAPQYSDANRFISWSMAKTITAMLVGELVTDGRLSLDAPAPIAEWRRAGDPRGRITLRHLLQMRSGLRHTEVGEEIANSDTNQVLFVSGTRAMAARAIAQPLEAPPGATFEYSSLTTIILSEIVTRTLTPSRDPIVRARTYRAFADQRLFAPAGVTSAVLEFDGAGTQIGGSLMHLSLDDWGRMGRLLIDGRAFNGRQVIAPAWLSAMKTPSPTNAEYGFQTWLNRPGGAERATKLFPRASDRAVAMRGHLGQLVVADPDGAGGAGTVVVRLGHTSDRTHEAVEETVGALVATLESRRQSPRLPIF